MAWLSDRDIALPDIWKALGSIPHITKKGGGNGFKTLKKALAFNTYGPLDIRPPILCDKSRRVSVRTGRHLSQERLSVRLSSQ